MLFNEIAIDLKLNSKVASSSSLIAGQFSIQNENRELVITVSSSLDKIIINEVSFSGELRSDEPISSIHYIFVKDVVKAIFVKKLPFNMLNRVERIDANSDSDFCHKNDEFVHILLIGCSNCIRLYDLRDRANLFNVSAQTPITLFAMINSPTSRFHNSTGNSKLTICAGPQRLYLLRFEPVIHEGPEETFQFSADFSSQRSIEDTVTCLLQDRLYETDILVTGSMENFIRIYKLDLFDENIHSCLLTIEESGPVNSLSIIDTSGPEGAKKNKTNLKDSYEDSDDIAASSLPKLERKSAQTNKLSNVDFNLNSIQTLHSTNFAFILENGFVGAYRLISKPNSSTREMIDVKETILKERIWRHKCQSVPFTSLMMDTNGDGLDELVIGFRNNRVESRHPLTGQLVNTTRCFKSDRLVSLAKVVLNDESQMSSGNSARANLGKDFLLACSSLGSLIGFGLQVSKPHVPLQGYNLPISNFRDPHISIKEDLDESRIVSTTDFGSILASKQRSSQNTDNLKPKTCESKQNIELLQKLNSLLIEQTNLKHEANRLFLESIYHDDVFNQSEATSLEASYFWDLDKKSMHLRLRIRLLTGIHERIRFILLEDESENLINSRYLMVDLTTESYKSKREQQNDTQTDLIVVLLRPKRDKPSTLRLQFLCQIDGYKVDGSTTVLSRIYDSYIEVPKFAFFTLSSDPRDEINFVTSKEKFIRLILKQAPSDGNPEDNIEQVLDWIHDNFLCFKFDKPIKCRLTRSSIGQRISSKEDRDGHRRSRDSNRQVANESESAFDGLDRQTNIRPDRHPRLMLDSEGQDNSESSEIELYILDVGRALEHLNTKEKTSDNAEPHNRSSPGDDHLKTRPDDGTLEGDTVRIKSLLKISVTKATGQLKLESTNFELISDITHSLVDGKIFWPRTSLKSLREDGLLECHLKPLEEDLERTRDELRQINESEKRLQSEIYESANYSKSMIQQLAIGIDLNEFSTSKDLLSEMFIMLTGAQTSARAHCLNKKVRLELERKVRSIEAKFSSLFIENT